jgi:hypothetical protein
MRAWIHASSASMQHLYRASEASLNLQRMRNCRVEALVGVIRRCTLRASLVVLVQRWPTTLL